MLTHSLDYASPFRSFPVPSHYGQQEVSHNEVLQNRAYARKLWKLIARNPMKDVGTMGRF